MCDTGPLVALINRLDSRHQDCVAAFVALQTRRLLTTWHCVTEAMYFLGRSGGIVAQDQLWELVDDGTLEIQGTTPTDWVRLRELMIQYADAPMDIADASLVLVAELTGLRRIFTLDRHFFTYLIHGTDTFDIVP